MKPVKSMVCASALSNIMESLTDSFVDQFSRGRDELLYTPGIMEDLADIVLLHQLLITTMTFEEVREYLSVLEDRKKVFDECFSDVDKI